MPAPVRTRRAFRAGRMSRVQRDAASSNVCDPQLDDRCGDRLGASRIARFAVGDAGVSAWLLKGVPEEICALFKLLSRHDDEKPDMSQTFSKKCFTGRMAFDILFLAPKSATVRAVSSGVEHYLDTVGVTSSNLVSPTTNDTGHREVPVACFAISRHCEVQAPGGPFSGSQTARASDASSEVGSRSAVLRFFSGAGKRARAFWGKGGAAGTGDFRTARRGSAACSLVSETADAPRFDALVRMRYRQGARRWIRATAGRRAPARSTPVWLERPVGNRGFLRRSAPSLRPVAVPWARIARTHRESASRP